MSAGRFLRKTYEITGYANTEDGYCLCEDCADGYHTDYPDKPKLTPIFLGDEWDFPGPCCDWCHDHIDAQLINYDED